MSDILGHEAMADLEASLVARGFHKSIAAEIAKAVNQFRGIHSIRAEARREAFIEAAATGYRVCADTRHVTLGREVRREILAAAGLPDPEAFSHA